MTGSSLYRLRSLTVEVVEGSIANPGRQLDALVSSDDNYLSHGGGVSAALWKAAGASLAMSTKDGPPPLTLGDVHVTSAGDLPARILLHAITIDFDANRTIAAPHLPFLYGEVFRIAASRGCTSVGLPLLAAGAAGITHIQSARAFVEAVQAIPETPHRGTIVLFVLPQVHGGVRPVLDAGLEASDAGWTLLRALRQLPRTAGPTLVQRWQAEAKAGQPNRIRTLALLEGLVEVGRESAEEAHLWHASGERLQGAIGVLRMVRGQVDQAKGPLTHAEAKAAEDAILGLGRALAELRDERSPEDSGGLFAEPTLGSSNDRPARQKQIVLHDTTPPPQPAAAGETATRGVPPPAPSISPQAEGGTAHVRALHKLILERLPRAHFEKLQLDLERQGYSGEPEFRLLEHLVRHDNPVALLTRFFDIFALGAILEVYGATADSEEPHTRVAERVLELLGFHLPRRARGLDAARQAVGAARARLQQAVPGAPQVRGDVLCAGTWLECACHVLLRFVTLVLYERPPEVLLRELGMLEPGEDLARAGLGRLFTLLDKLHRLIRETPPPRMSVTRFSSRALLPPHGKGKLPGIRNHFAHWRPSESQSPSEELRQAREFADGAAALLEYLADPEHRVFPRVLKVTEIRYDTWGRRLAQAEAEDGHAETIFTDAHLRPGEIYFMHPLSNPVRVDPLLFPAGDLAFPEGD